MRFRHYRGARMFLLKLLILVPIGALLLGLTTTARGGIPAPGRRKLTRSGARSHITPAPNVRMSAVLRGNRVPRTVFRMPSRR